MCKEEKPTFTRGVSVSFSFWQAYINNTILVDICHFTVLNRGMTLTISDIDEIEERFKGVFATKEDLVSYKSDLMEKLDDILKEILASREEETVLSHRVSVHEDRIENIEKKLDIQPAI